MRAGTGSASVWARWEPWPAATSATRWSPDTDVVTGVPPTRPAAAQASTTASAPSIGERRLRQVIAGTVPAPRVTRSGASHPKALAGPAVG